MSRPARFTQADVERVMRASKKLGVPVELDLETGVARILTQEPGAVLPSDTESWAGAMQKWRRSV